MNEYTWPAIAVLAIVASYLSMYRACLAAIAFIVEIRQWRQLVHAYLEKRVGVPLPVYEIDPAAPPESSLHLPPEDLDELEREDEEEADAKYQ